MNTTITWQANQNQVSQVAAHHVPDKKATLLVFQTVNKTQLTLPKSTLIYILTTSAMLHMLHQKLQNFFQMQPE